MPRQGDGCRTPAVVPGTWGNDGRQFVSITRAFAFHISAARRISFFASCKRSGHSKVGAFEGAYPFVCPVSRVSGFVYFSFVSPETSLHIAAGPGSYSCSSARVSAWLWS